MPHLVLEYSANVIEKNNFNALFQQCHALLAKLLPTDIHNCKSRTLECTSYYVGTGQPQNAFIHVSLKIMPGRDTDTLNQVAQALLSLFQDHFAESLQTLDLQITLEINGLPQTYFKLNTC